MNEPDLIFSPHNIDIESVIGEVPKLRLKIEVKDTNRSEGLEQCVQVNRISLDVELHGANSPSSSRLVGSLGTNIGTDPATMVLGLSNPVFLSFPLNSAVVERMLEIRDNNQQVAFKISGTVTAIYYYKEQSGCSILDVLQTRCAVYKQTSDGKIYLLLIPAPKLNDILNRVNYAEIMKFEIPIYTDKSSINPVLTASIRLLKDAKMQLCRGNNEAATMDVRKALTNHLLVEEEDGQKKLDSSLRDSWVEKSPAETKEIYKEIFLRLQEGLRAVLKITNKFLHDEKTLAMAPLRKDAEYAYFTVAFTVKRLVDQIES